MIVEMICDIFFNLIISLISTISIPVAMPGWAADAVTLVGVGLMIFPVDVWSFCLGSIALWTGIQFGWAIIEWIYKKIPGVS